MRLSIAILVLLILLPNASSRAQSKEGSAFDQSKFVPDIALILDVSGVARGIRDQTYDALMFPGFSFPFQNQLGASGANAHRGMNFNYGELSLYSVVDPYFDLFAVIDLSPKSAGLEEAYFSTRKLPYGFMIKTGKFLASFGRINEQHEHFWDFANRPLIASALLGEDGLNEIGAQATWVAPTSFFLVAGAEVMNGENEQSFGTTGFTNQSGSISVEPIQGPNLYIGFLRASVDIGDASILFGISNAAGTTRTDQGFSASGAAIDAHTDIIGADATAKYTLDAIRFISFQGEYMHRTMSGTDYAHTDLNTSTSRNLEKRHSGFYSQVAAKIDQLWELGVRVDLLMQNDVSLSGAEMHLPSNLPRYSAMIEYYPTEFSRFRLQVDRDESRFVPTSAGWSRRPYTQVLFQANLTIGAHGAHAF
jgi:hypothetical protein